MGSWRPGEGFGAGGRSGLVGAFKGPFCLPALDNARINCYKTNMSPRQVKALRKALNLTQQQLADLIAAQRVSVARWETGASRPTGAYLKALQELAEKAKRKGK